MTAVLAVYDVNGRQIGVTVGSLNSKNTTISDRIYCGNYKAARLLKAMILEDGKPAESARTLAFNFGS